MRRPIGVLLLANVLFFVAAALGCHRAEVCDDNDDNDNDGYTDCGDSDCTGAAACPPCGDGLITKGEDCDSGDYGGANCANMGLGFIGGTLTCNSDCTFDTSGCLGSGTCGNNLVDQAAEWCDGTDLASQDCTDFGYAGGTLACDSFCFLEPAACTGSPCGDGVIDFFEQCDGTNLDGEDCVSIGFGYSGGTLACGTSCYYDVTACAFCGDDVLQSPEACDGADLGGQTCATLAAGFTGGTLDCDFFCEFDTGGCT